MAGTRRTGHASAPSGPRPVALVAGGSRGLGLLIARELSARGCRTVICARDRTEVDEALRLLDGWGQQVTGYVCDVADHHAVDDVVARVGREVGAVEVSVHVAGLIQVGPLASVTREDFEEAIGVMTWGPINLALAVLPGMRALGRGRIATVTSIGGMVSVPHLLPYSTAKFGAVGFSQGLRAELAGSGLTVTTVVPGLMRTGSHLRARFTGAQREYAWFAPGASLPVLSMDAERAAARIAEGVLAGKGVILLTPLAKIGARVAGIAPSVTSSMMGLVAQVLPSGPSGRAPVVDGQGARRRLGSRFVELLTVLGTRAARRFNEIPPEPSPRVEPGPAGQRTPMTMRPVRSMTFEQLRAEIAGHPLEGEPDDSATDRVREVRAEIDRRGGAPVPLASAGLDDAPTDPERPHNSA